MTSIFDQAGYYLNDNRCSGGAREEDDMIGCRHCERPLRRSVWKLSGGRCMVCDSFLHADCYAKVAKFGCQVFERAVTQAINEDYRRSQNAKVYG